jgi:hypothetical protein
VDTVKGKIADDRMKVDVEFFLGWYPSNLVPLQAATSVVAEIFSLGIIHGKSAEAAICFYGRKNHSVG